MRKRLTRPNCAVAIITSVNITFFLIKHAKSIHIYLLLSFAANDPEPDVPKDVTPMAQCAFESLMFNVSAVYTN